MNVPLHALSFATPSVGYAVGEQLTVYKTTDGGSTWTTDTTDPQAEGSRFNDVKAVDATHAWAVGGTPAFVYATSDGATWTQQTVDGVGNGGSLNSLQMKGLSNGWAGGLDNDGGMLILKLQASGHWAPGNIGTQALPTATVTGLSFTDATHGWAAVAHGSETTSSVWGTTDGGANWHILTDHPTQADPNAILFLSPSHGFLGCFATFWDKKTFLETTDGGVTWTPYDPDPTGGQSTALVIAFASTDASHAWAGGGWGILDPAAVWSLTLKSGKQRLGEPIIRPQFPRTPFKLEETDWLTAYGTLAIKHKRGTYPITIVMRKIGKRWVTRRKFAAKLSKSGYTYSAAVVFPGEGKWRVRAVHGGGSAAILSPYTYYTIIHEDWDNP